jgi:predicted nucleic acid-binding protein
MIVLDTHVVSEAMKPEPYPAVRAWLNEQAAETLYLSSVTLAELLFGIKALAAAKRKEMLALTLDGLMGLFSDRVLAFDTDAARHYAERAATARAAGRGFPTPGLHCGDRSLAGIHRRVTRYGPPMRPPASPSSIRGKPKGVQLGLMTVEG